MVRERVLEKEGPERILVQCGGGPCHGPDGPCAEKRCRPLRSTCPCHQTGMHRRCEISLRVDLSENNHSRVSCSGGEGFKRTKPVFQRLA